jgi:serine/threonine protein kinase
VQGKLSNGEKVAIKVLSSESRQGTKEFLNELSVISNITHHNLVKLHGCCVDGGQKMLVYNYVENNSLAQTLFVASSLTGEQG